jgi:hypothetical protein
LYPAGLCAPRVGLGIDNDAECGVGLLAALVDAQARKHDFGDVPALHVFAPEDLELN